MAPLAENPLPREERDAYLAVCRWSRVSHLWRPNLPDEEDDHLIEFAVVGGATAIVADNEREGAHGEPRLSPSWSRPPSISPPADPGSWKHVSGDLAPIPTPAALPLVLTGVGALALFSRRRGARRLSRPA